MDTAKLLNLREFEPLARETLSQMIFDYYAGGANDDLTLHENEAAYQRIFLRPRMMTGMAERTMHTTVLGQSMKAPVLIAPMAYMMMAHPDGESAMSRAAAARGGPHQPGAGLQHARGGKTREGLKTPHHNVVRYGLCSSRRRK